jgi:hypothetical protein
MNALPNLDVSVIWVLFSRDHAKKGRLPGPIRADETDPVPGSEPKRGGVKEDLFSESFFQTDDFDQDKTLEKKLVPLYITSAFLKP